MQISSMPKWPRKARVSHKSCLSRHIYAVAAWGSGKFCIAICVGGALFGMSSVLPIPSNGDKFLVTPLSLDRRPRPLVAEVVHT